MMNPEKPEQPLSLQPRSSGAGPGFQFKLYLGSLRPRKLRYMLILCLGPMVFARRDLFFDIGLRLFGQDASALSNLSFFLGAGVLFLFASPLGIRLYARRLSIATAAMFLAWQLLPAGLPALIAALGFAFGLGGCAALAAYAYTRALNDAERLLGAVITSAVYMLARTGYALWPLSPHYQRFELTAVVAVTLVCLNLYRREDLAQAPRESKGLSGSVLPLMLFFMAAHRVIGIFYASLPLPSGRDALLPGALTGLFACALCLVLYFAFSRGVWYMCSLYFTAMIASLAAYAMREIPGSLVIARSLSGLWQIGFIASLYIFGRVMSPRVDTRCWRRLWLVMAGFLFVSDLISSVLTAQAPPAGLMAAGLVTFLLFGAYTLFLSSCAPPLPGPLQADTLACGVRHDKRKALRLAFLKAQGLTLREQQIAMLLLHGSTARQCAAELGIAEDTVKYHMKHLYRKLNINGRSELFLSVDFISDEPGVFDPGGQS